MNQQRWTALALVILVAAVFAQSYQGRSALVDSQRKACERGKLDRREIARALRAQSTYLNSVLGASSVKADVKSAASIAHMAYDRSASSLESRTGDRLDCQRAIAGPSPLPF